MAATLNGAMPAPIPTTPAVVSIHASHLGRFTLLRQIGEGSMGTVFAAYDEQLDRRVAIKLLHRPQVDSELQRQQILREARAVARISHPNVISVYEVGESAEHIYIAMEFVGGDTLHAWQSRGSRPWREVLELYLGAGAGLDAAHQAGVVHRDFKPDNVLIGLDGRARVVDFGLARVGWTEELESQKTPQADLPSGRPSGRLTLPGVISGTPGYMSPEQYLGGNVDNRSDQWSFCAALFEALYGFLPFAGETIREKATSVRKPPLLPPRDTQVPDEVHRALLRGLAVDPEQRFPSMAELLDSLLLEQGDHAGGGMLSRQRLMSLIVIGSILSLALMQIRRARQSLSARDMAIASLTMFIVVLGVGVYRRRTLLGNRFHRYVWILCLVTVAANLAQRCIAYKAGMPISLLFPFEMVVLAASTAIGGAFLIRWLLWIPVVPLAAAALSMTGWIPMPILSLTYIFVVIAIAVGWSRAAAQTQRARAPGDSQAVPLLRLRRTTSSPSSPSLSRSRSTARALSSPTWRDDQRQKS